MFVTITLAASAAANTVLAVSAALAARAYWPRIGLPYKSAGRSFYLGLLLVASCITFGSAAWGLVRVLQLWNDIQISTPQGAAARLFELVWKPGAAIGFLLMVRAKLLALDPVERRSWNMLTIPWHPDTGALAVRAIGAISTISGRKD